MKRKTIPLTAAALNADARDSAAKAGAAFNAPDDDWLPVLIARAADGRAVIAGIELDEALKDHMVDVVAEVLRRANAAGAALVISAWTVEAPAGPAGEFALEMARLDGVRNHPLRKEVLIVESCDGKATEVWHAEIRRRPDGPSTLGPWERQDVEASGRMANVLQRAFDALRKRGR